jgi:hypothetical protein
MPDTFNVEQQPQVPSDNRNRTVSQILSVHWVRQANLAQLIAIDGTPIGGPKWEWFDKTMQESFTLLTANILAHAASAAGLTITVADSSIFQVGDQVFVDTLQPAYQVTAIPNGTTLTVTEIRGVALGADAGNGERAVINRGRLEKTSAANQIGAHLGVKKQNFTQIFRSDYEVTRHAQIYSQRGGIYTETDLVVNAKDEAMKDFVYQLYHAATKGVGIERTATNVSGYMAGVRQFIDVVGGNVQDAAATALDADKINDMIAEIFNDSAMDIMSLAIAMSPIQSRKLSTLDASKVAINDPRDNRVVGNNVASWIGDISGVGAIPIFTDQNMPSNEVWFLNRDKIRMRPFEVVSDNPIPEDGTTSIKGYLYGEYTLEVRDGELAHGIIKGLTV